MYVYGTVPAEPLQNGTDPEGVQEPPAAEWRGLAEDMG